jgi:uncharacterized protein (TIGR00251 family)
MARDEAAGKSRDTAARRIPAWCTAGDGRLTISLHVQPGARRTEVAGMHGEALKLRLAAPPVEGKANKALIDFIARLLGVPRAQVRLVRGEASRDKVVAVEVADAAAARALLESRLPSGAPGAQ